ncbi:hypothetical protein B0A48_10402 [Cryoendolithus antarcticus]|uniref:Helix-turn-helix domain-containing protein n=1 Tax=Cryoendolithus antarcticus TaxID=1507870 RepID=A0A1V8SX60_9PEZI|nr:hypothetical protein B0A48_10402 [Cryoendolithus antarcticus]
MGSATSKASRAAAGTAARQYPKRAPNTSPPSSGPTARPPPSASTSRSPAINSDASDPHFSTPPTQNLETSDPSFARQLRSLGAVQPNPTLSESSTFNPQFPSSSSAPSTSQPPRATNPALLVLEARARLQAEADREFLEAGRGKAGRQFLDAYTIRQILVMRDGQGKSGAEIEKKMGLKAGVVGRLGKRGVVSVVTEVGRGARGVEMV